MFRKPAVPLLLGIALLWGEWAWGADLGMQIDSATQKDGVITVTTTGAKFQIDGQGAIRCWQRIPREREVLNVSLGKPVGPFRIERKERFSCTVSCQAGGLTFHGDSLVIFKLNGDIKTVFRGLFAPAYRFEKQGKWILMDEEGGFGIYPVAVKRASAPETFAPPWNIAYDFSGGDEVWLSVFPPRAFNWKRAHEAIEHDGLPDGTAATTARLETGGGYPSNAQIQDAARHCKVLTLHSYTWQDAPEDVKARLTPILHTEKYAGHPQPWLTPNFIPLKMNELIRVREEAHRDGMKVVVYLSPFYSAAPDIFAEMQRVLDEYQVDGLYFDGISFDFRESYATIRRAREILGDDRILYVHCSNDPLSDGRIYCPFIDTYADYILRGEAGVSGLKLDDFLRWTISSYNIGNAVGYWCYYGSNQQQGYGGNAPKSGTYFHTVPTKESIQAALRNKVLIWREGQVWGQPKLRDRLALFDEQYYSKVEKLGQQWENEKASPK
jgi:hypothetical protein